MNLNNEELREIINLLNPIYVTLGDNHPSLYMIEKKLIDSYIMGYSKCLSKIN